MSRFDVIRFLEEYERYPCLWQKNSIDFRNRVKRDYAEEMLLPISGLANIKELRQKIRSIRCTYNQEIAKIKKSMVTGSAAGDIYQPKLIWFSSADCFLRQNYEDNESDSNLTLLEVKEEDEEPDATNSDVPQEPISPPLSPAGKSKTSHKRPGSSMPRIQGKRKKVNDALDDAVEALKEVAAGAQSVVNEFTTFGQHVAVQLQCLPLEEAITLQEDIQKLITAARLHNIRKLSSSSTNNCELRVRIRGNF